MKTLENGVVAIQQEKLDLTLSNYELMKKCDDEIAPLAFLKISHIFRFYDIIL